jgi:hypothetical protein
MRLRLVVAAILTVGLPGCVNNPRLATYEEMRLPVAPQRRPAWILRLPDLAVVPQEQDSFYYDPSRDAIWVRARVKNEGALRSAAFDVNVDIQVTHAGTTQRAGGYPKTVTFPALDPGATHYQDFGPIPVEQHSSRFDVYVIADPPSASRPSGALLESNEDNNGDVYKVSVM